MELPLSLINSLQMVKGFDEKAFRQVHESGEQVTSVRINPGKVFNIEYSAINEQPEKIPWTGQGYYLSQRPSFTSDPLFHGGAYYVQEASSMFLEEALRQTVDLSGPLRILDLCAAPGGKSTLIQSLISHESLLVSNEVIRTRVNILSENITKWGGANVIVTNNDPKDFNRLEFFFDVIVVDAPCSGSGLFRKDPSAIKEWSEQNVQLCSHRQQRILEDVLPALKDGGILIYSTCSYSTEEDEIIADWLVGGCRLSSVNFQLKPEWNIVETLSGENNAYGYRFYPDKVRGEGFFIAAFRKEQGAEVTSSGEGYLSKHKNKAAGLTPAETGIAARFLHRPDDFFFIKQNDEAIAIPRALSHELAYIQSALYIKKAGIRMGAVVHGDLIPHHELALSTAIDAGVNRVDTDKATALQYLRREEIKAAINGKGWTLLTYGQLPLGWMKILPNRINNYYPPAWRILNK